MQNGLQEPDRPVASTDLVAVTGCGARMAPMPRPLAGFLTQLVACRDQLPAYRARRRIEPGRAAASYGERAQAPRNGRYERIF
jgi:hypothetical protein